MRFTKENAHEYAILGGRPAGSKDKSHLLAETWSNRLDEDWKDLKPAQRAFICCRIFCALVARQVFHLTPEESVKNADAAFALVQRMEKALGVNVSTGNAGSDQERLAVGAVSLQAPPPTDNGV
jgi:hypothetical protein